MAVEILSFVWCDNHPNIDKVPGEPGLWLIPPMAVAREIDLCEQCRGLLPAGAVLALITELGRAPGPLDRRPGQPVRLPGALTSYQQTDRRNYPCLLCDVVKGDQNGLANHYRRTHALPADWSSPTCAITLCPLCGVDYRNASGIGQHVFPAHGTRTVAQALKRAAAEGDEFGVVAKALAYLAELGAT